MLDRRRLLAALGSWTVGLLVLPGQAAAGLFRRRRCKAAPACCPVPCPGQTGTRPGYGTLIGIDNPANGATVGQSFTADGWYSASYVNPCIHLVIQYADSSRYPTSGFFQATCTAGRWNCQIDGAPKTQGNQMATLYAVLKDETCTTPRDADNHQIKIQ